jgi:hypothetical protein
MGVAVLRAIDVEVGEQGAAPLSFELNRGEVHGLLCPPGVERGPLLRVLAGLEKPRKGSVVLPSGPARVVQLGPERASFGALPEASDILLVDARAMPANHELHDRGMGEVEGDTAFLVATSSLEQVYRSDHVSLALWDERRLTKAFLDLSKQVSGLATEFLREMDRGGGLAGSPLRMQHLHRLTRAILGEIRDLKAHGRGD